MSETQLRAICFSGSIRKGSFNGRLADLMVNKLVSRGVAAERLRLEDYPLPIFNEDLEADGQPENARKLGRAFLDNHIVFIASPENNGGMTALTKNSLDWVSRQEGRPFRHPVFGLGAVSSGKLSGAVGLTHLRDVITKVVGLIAPIDVRVGPSDGAFGDDGELTEKLAASRLESLADMLVELGRART